MFSLSMKIVAFVVFFVIFVIALVFSVLNFQPVSINLYFFTISLPLTVALTIELIFGIVVGFLASMIHVLKLKADYARLSKER